MADISAEIIGQLKQAMVAFEKIPVYERMIGCKEEIFARFQPVFLPETIESIQEDEFRSFLLDKNNHHWSGMHRSGPKICADMEALRKGLELLLDEKQPFAERLDKAIAMVHGMGKNIATAILIIVYPEQYGVWNNRSEGSMKRLCIWPDFARGESDGKRYVKINQVLLKLRDELGIDLWTLDGLLWYVDEHVKPDEEAESVPHDTFSSDDVDAPQCFGLERHLHEFMRDNWSRLDLGKEWEIYKDAGDEEAGYEYPCDIGRIDILAKHKRLPRWLVIELKRNQTSDQTVGQLLRYVGWVKQKMADQNEEVEGMIICREADASLHYALSMIPKATLRLYKVQFELIFPPEITGTNL